MTATIPAGDFPTTLAFDPENAVLAGAGNGWFAAIACDSTLHRGGVGAEIARRWNAHPALLAFAQMAARATTETATPLSDLAILRAEATSVLAALSRGASS